MDDKVGNASILMGAMTETALTGAMTATALTGAMTATAKCGTGIRVDRHPDRWTTPSEPKTGASIPQARVPEFVEQWPIEKIAVDMVDFAESLHRCLPAGAALLHEGENSELELAKLDRKLIVLLARSGIARNDPTGLPFDPRYHQKVAERQVSSEIPGTIVQTLSSTWTLNGQLLRPAMVVVSVAPSNVPFVHLSAGVSAVSCHEGRSCMEVGRQHRPSRDVEALACRSRMMPPADTASRSSAGG